MTNAERIKSMTIEELAGILYCDQCIYRGMPECGNRCKYGISEWLKQEVNQNGQSENPAAVQ